MSCRRKTKNERELVSDICKTFKIECSKYNCNVGCPYNRGNIDCIINYISMLLKEVDVDVEPWH